MNKLSESLFTDSWDLIDKENASNLTGPILIVGGSGFIGAKLFFSLRKYRNDVYLCSSKIHQSWRLLGLNSEINLKHKINLDVRNFTDVKKVFSQYKPRTIFNLMTYGGKEFQNDILKIHEVNYMGTLNLILAASEYGCDAFVHTGSSSEYGFNCKAPLEEAVLEPNSNYSVAKIGASYLLNYYGVRYSFPCVNLRLYSIYGPWEDRDRFISKIIQSGVNKTYPLLGAEDISRDYVYIDDCTSALVSAALTACKHNLGQSINICTEIKSTIRDVALTAKDLFQINNDPTFGTFHKRKWDLEDWYGNNSKAKEILKWKPKIDLKQGLQLTAEWEKCFIENKKIYSTSYDYKTISIIIACYKDNQAIPVMYEKIKNVFVQTNYKYQIIFVNDNSPYDDEVEIKKICAMDSNVVGICHSRNFGSQSAFLSGLNLCDGDAAVLMDGDLQDPPEVILDFITKWEEGHEIVYGVRIKRKATFFMQIMYKIFYRIFKKLADINIPLDAGDFSLIDRKCITYLINFKEKDFFLRGLRAWIGFKQVGVPYVRPERMFGVSTNNIFKNIWWAKKAIFSFSSKPLEYIQYIGILISLVSFGLLLFNFVLYLVIGKQATEGITTIILFMFGIGGAQLFLVSILGDYIGKVLEEVKSRPHFIRSKIIVGDQDFDKVDDYQKLQRKY